MPKGKSVKASDISVPRTLKRSSPKAQRTYAKTMASAENSYGSGEKAARTAMAAVKRSFEKVGDHWEAKNQKGPSDERSRKRGAAGDRKQGGRTAGGVDVVGHSRDELLKRAKSLGITGISRMNKQQLGEAIARHQ
ncbi:MAG: ChaB family protein [Polycyclovorans sp.]|jgi:hypothetical protein|nr:ChaB family protein [Polycyclovorans sp.]